MVDTFSKAQRSDIMRCVHGKNTSPEIAVRRIVSSLGYRYRLHRRDLPGAPDLVFIGLRKVLFVNGCFWHMHHCSRGKSTPSANGAYWRKKRESNARRDRSVRRKLRSQGWDILTVWECQIRDASLWAKLESFLAQSSNA